MKNGEDQQLRGCAAHDWKQHEADARRAFAGIEELKAAVRNIHSDTRHLVQLPSIAQSLQDMRDTLVDRATQREPMLARAFLVIVGAFSLVCVLMILYFTELNLKANSDGLTLEGHESKAASELSEQKKTQ